MKILTAVKRVPDPDARLRLRPDGIGLLEDEVPYVMNPFDAIALEEALRTAERTPDVEVVTVSIGGDPCEETLRTALAMGASRAIHVVTASALDSWNVAQLLAAVAQRELPDVALMGKQAIDDDANQAGQMLAALLAWPQATFASNLEWLLGEPRRVRVCRETDWGLETIVIDLPAVLTADLRLNEPRYASLPSLMKARRKPIERLTPSDLGVEIEPRVTLLELALVSTSRDCKRVGDVPELVACLRDEAKVL